MSTNTRAPRVSVCIATYNRSAYLRATIDSVLAQTYGDFELIVSDDCSPDDTAAVVATYHDSRLRYHRNVQNLGMAGNYNRCLELARGDCIGIVDDDDLYLPAMLGTTTAALDAYPDAGFVFGVADEIDDRGLRVGVRRAHAGDALLDPDAAYALLLGSGRVPQPTTLARARAIAQVGPYNPAFGSWCDADMWLRLGSRFPVVFLDRVIAQYRLTTGSETQAGERDGRAATHLRAILLKALASPPGGRRPPLGVVRRARREVAQYELAIAFGFLYRGAYAAYRDHLWAALTLAPELLASPSGAVALVYGAASFAGGRWPRLIWGARRHALGRRRLPAGALQPEASPIEQRV